MARYQGNEGSYGRKGPGSSKGPKAPKGRKPKTPKTPKGRKGRSGKGHRPGQHVVHPGVWHEAAGAAVAGKSAGAQPAQGHPAGSGMAAHVIRAPLSTGLGDVLLELVGEGTITLGAALGAWQRDQERVTNRAWRRPGGLARMGGL